MQNSIAVINQFDLKAHTACAFIAPNMLKNAYILAYIKKNMESCKFVEYYNNILHNGISLWKKHGSPGELDTDHKLIRKDFDELFKNSYHDVRYCDRDGEEYHGTYNTHEYCQILLMKSDYDIGVKKLIQVLKEIAENEFNALLLNRAHKFFVIVSIHRGKHDKYLILDSHEHNCQELTLINTVLYITKKKTFFGGIDFLMHKIKDIYEENEIQKEQLTEHIQMHLYLHIKDNPL